MFYQVFLLPPVKRSVISSSKHGICELPHELKSTQLYSQNENFVNTSKKNRNWTFPVVRCFIWKLEFVSNILCIIVSADSFLLLIVPGPFKLYLRNDFGILFN